MVNLAILEKGVCLYDKKMKLFIHEFSFTDSITKVETILGIRFSFVSRDNSLAEMLVTPNDKVYALLHKMYLEIGDTYPMDKKIRNVKRSEVDPEGIYNNEAYNVKMGFDWKSKIKIVKNEQGLLIKYCGDKKARFKQVIMDHNEIKNGELFIEIIDYWRGMGIDEANKTAEQRKAVKDSIKRLNIKERGRMVGIQKLIDNKGICIYNEKTMLDIYTTTTPMTIDGEEHSVAAIAFDFNGQNKKNMAITVNVEDQIFPILEKMYFNLEYVDLPKYSKIYGENKDHVIIIKDDNNKTKKSEDASCVKITGNRENITLEYVGPSEAIDHNVIVSNFNSVNGESKQLTILQAIHKIEMLATKSEVEMKEAVKTLKMEK